MISLWPGEKDRAPVSVRGIVLNAETNLLPWLRVYHICYINLVLSWYIGFLCWGWKGSRGNELWRFLADWRGPGRRTNSML